MWKYAPAAGATSIRLLIFCGPHERLPYFFHTVILQRTNILPTTLNNMYNAVSQPGNAVAASAKSASPSPFFPKLSSIGQRFIPSWPIIGMFNQHSNRPFRKEAIAYRKMFRVA
jgi:hypothetical protein